MGMNERVSNEDARHFATSSQPSIVNDLAGDLLDARAKIEELEDRMLFPATPESLGAERLDREKAERERDEARPVLEAARYQAMIHGSKIAYREACYQTELAISSFDAARAAEGGEDE